MKPAAIGAALALLAAAPTAACTSRDCTSEARFGITVTVVDATGSALCAAQVSIVDGDHVEEPRSEQFGDRPCRYAGAIERPGTYKVHVVVDGVEQVQQAKVTKDQCHVKNVQLRFTFPT